MEYLTIFGFSGINRQVSPFLVADGDVSESQNFVTNKIGVLKKSFDYSIKGIQVTNQNSILSGFDFFRNDTTHDHVISTQDSENVEDTEIFIYSGGEWVNQLQHLSTTSIVRFAYSPTIDTLFTCNYDDATRSYKTGWSTITNVTDAAQAKYIINWGNRIYLLNCFLDGVSYPSRAYRSDAIETSATWTSDQYIPFEDVVTGVGVNGENLFVGCQNSIHILTLAEEKFRVSDVGCVSHEGIAACGRYTFYHGADGFYAFDGSTTFKVSSPIQEYWDGIPQANWDKIQATTKGDHVYVYIGDITAPWDSSETLENVVFDYNVLQNNWNRGRLSADCTSLHTYVTSSGRELFMGDSEGHVYQLFDDSGQQNGEDYSSHVETHWVYGSGAEIKDDYSQIIGYGMYLSSLQVKYKTEEREDWKSLGELTKDTDILNFRRIRSYKIKFRLDEFSGKNLFELERLDIGFTPAYFRNEKEDI